MPQLVTRIAASAVLLFTIIPGIASAADPLRELQAAAIQAGRSDVAHWGPDSEKYISWSSHTNRLIPVYTFGTRGAGEGIDLGSYAGANSPYRSEEKLKAIYGFLPTHTLNPQAEYFDQTNLGELQRAALQAGRKHIFLVVFDGMDWQTTRAAAIYNSGRVGYDQGRGAGLHFLDYDARGTSQFGFVVTSPHDEGTDGNPDRQELIFPVKPQPGGYNVAKAGPTPWQPGNDLWYPIGLASKGVPGEHAYPDSAATATSLCTGVKTYNAAINIDPSGHQLQTVAHLAQERGYAVGTVTSVPISHATPAASYAHNVSRDDFQDLSRDLLGLPSASHPHTPLPGLDVLIGSGAGTESKTDKGQGANFIPGNRYLTAADLQTVDVAHGGRYVVAQRTPGQSGTAVLQAATATAARSGKRLLGMFGFAKTGHLPFQTADGDYRPAPGKTGKAEEYSDADLRENPTLADMTAAAITVLSRNPQGFWMMVEAGDVDWANHDNNLDASIGAVKSGDAAVKVITDWVEQHSNWNESLLIVTADHGHYLVLTNPQAVADAARAAR